MLGSYEVPHRPTRDRNAHCWVCRSCKVSRGSSSPYEGSQLVDALVYPVRAGVPHRPTRDRNIRRAS
jgi:hypothetical protein